MNIKLVVLIIEKYFVRFSKRKKNIVEKYNIYLISMNVCIILIKVKSIFFGLGKDSVLRMMGIIVKLLIMYLVFVLLKWGFLIYM